MKKKITTSFICILMLVVLCAESISAEGTTIMPKNIAWSENPGCFEQHLQRRFASKLFLADRRNVTIEELNAAREKDRTDQDRFILSVKTLGAELENLEDSNPSSTLHDSSALQKVQALLEEAATIGGNIHHAISALESTEESIIQNLNRIRPEGKELLKQAHSLSVMARVPIIAQLKRKDTPIQPNEEIPSILSEDHESIAVVGFISRSFPDFRPSESDIKLHLEKAIKDGFIHNDINNCA